MRLTPKEEKINKMKTRIFFLLNLSAFLMIGCSNRSHRNNPNHRDTTFEVTTNLRGDTLDIRTIVNGLPNGEFRSYYDNGQIHVKNWYVDGDLEGEEIVYTENGQVAEVNLWKNSSLFNQKIYWQSIPFTEEKKHTYISDTGINAIKNGISCYDLNSHPPEGFIIIDRYDKNYNPVYYIYRNGRFEKYPANH